jgi:hypothetical protein
MKKWLVGGFCGGLMILLALAACGGKQTAVELSSSVAITAMTEDYIIVTNDYGQPRTMANGQYVTVPAKKIPQTQLTNPYVTTNPGGQGQAPANPAGQTPGQETPTLPNAADGNDWNLFPQPDPSRPYDLYNPGAPVPPGPAQGEDPTAVGYTPWPVAALPAQVPVAAAYIDKLADRVVDGVRVQSVYIIDMPYTIFRGYVDRLTAAGFSTQASLLPANAPSGESAIFVGQANGLTVKALWSPSDLNGFESNFRLIIETRAS